VKLRLYRPTEGGEYERNRQLNIKVKQVKENRACGDPDGAIAGRHGASGAAVA
jgi:hypothetical protein